MVHRMACFEMWIICVYVGYTDSVRCCKMLLICSTLVTKSSKMCRLLVAFIFINITMGWGGDGNNFMGMGMLLHPHVTL